MDWITEADRARLDPEVHRVEGLCRSMVDAYLNWDWRTGSVMSAVYGDVVDFVNFRVESALACLELLARDRIADGLGLCRSLLENSLLLMLMCRGTKYFQIANLSGKSPDEFRTILADQQEQWKAQKAAGETTCLDVRQYPRAKRHIMYVFEGLRSSDPADTGFLVPLHYFQFREFRPETMRLRGEDYFEYYQQGVELAKALKEHRSQAHFSYQHYLSYSALLVCLELNDILDAESMKRVEAHYTFLGRFIHPTHEAARNLHLRANTYMGRPAVGMDGQYSPAARLLLASYVAHLLATALDEIAGLVESAPPKYIADAETESIRAATRAVDSTVGYFWFLFNEPTTYDKFEWAVNHASDELLAEHGHYQQIPGKYIPFNQHIFDHFAKSLVGWSNQRVGDYTPPVPIPDQ